MIHYYNISITIIQTKRPAPDVIAQFVPRGYEITLVQCVHGHAVSSSSSSSSSHAAAEAVSADPPRHVGTFGMPAVHVFGEGALGILGHDVGLAPQPRGLVQLHARKRLER